MWLVGGVVRRYIDFLIILLIPTPLKLVLALFFAAEPLLPCSLNVFCSLRRLRRRKKNAKSQYFTLRGAYISYALIQLEIICRTRWWCLKCVIMYLV